MTRRRVPILLLVAGLGAVARLAASQQPTAPSLDDVLVRAGNYVAQYEGRLGAISAQEDYEQAVVTTAQVTRPVDARPVTRTTRAYMLSLNLGSLGWVTYRDVFELDGRPVRDHEDRLSRLLPSVTQHSLQQAQAISAESARYNLSPEKYRISRTLNVPLAALIYLRRANQSHSKFRLGKPELVAGIRCIPVQFTERSSPRLIGTVDDAPAHGTFWTDDTGRVIKTDLRLESEAGRGEPVHAQIVVAYSRVDKLDLWLPAKMDETYMFVATAQMMSGHAAYSDFREFKITTSEDIK